MWTTEAKAREAFNQLKDEFSTFPWEESDSKCWVKVMRMIKGPYEDGRCAVIVGVTSWVDGSHTKNNVPNRYVITRMLPYVEFSALSHWSDTDSHTVGGYTEVDFWVPGG